MNTHPSHRHTVIVGVADLEDARRAVSWAAAEAGRRRWPLRIIHAVDHAHAQLALSIGPEPAHFEEPTVARKIVDSAVAEVERTRPDVDVTGKWIVGSPAVVLARAADGQGIVVVGSRGLGRLASVLLGSVSSEVVQHANCPVVVVRETTARPAHAGRPRSLVLGIDGSPASGAATGFAFEEASLRGLPLTVVHVVWSPYTESQAVVAAMSDPRRVVADDSERLNVAETIAGWREHYPDVGVVSRYENGRPDGVLTDLSDGAELLVVGARGRGPATAALLGSVSREVVRKAHCPVAVVRGPSRPARPTSA